MILKISKITDFSSEKLSECFEKLEEQEKQRISKKKNSAARNLSLAARCLLEDGLYEHYGIKNPQIKRTENGKPYLADNKVYFNISHTRDAVAVVFSMHPVGVDIEYTREYNEGVCRKMFSLSEQEFVNGDDVKFTKLWTLKEAMVKAVGQGVSKIKEYSFNIKNKTVVSNFENAYFTLEQQDGLIIAVCEVL